MKYYRELALGSPSTRGLVVPVSEISSYATLARRDNKELYASYYLFDESLVEHFKLYRTIKSFSGKYYLNNLILDVDPEPMLKERMYAVRDKIFMLGLHSDKHVQWWFSGRGFHIIIPWEAFVSPEPIDATRLPAIVKATAAEYFPMADNIYDGARLIRVGNTVNAKTGLYKIRITPESIFSGDFEKNMERIREWAKDYTRPDPSIDPVHSREVDRDSLPTIRTVVPEPETKPEGLILDAKHTLAEDPSRFVTCMQKLYLRGPIKGRRHTDMLRLVSAWQRNGIPQPAIRLLLREWTGGEMSDYELDRVISSVMEKGYRYSCTDSVMMEYCDPKCIFAKNKSFGSDVITSDSAEKKLVDFIRSLDDTTSLDLSRIFPGFPPFIIGAGEVTIFWADTGMGKSALAQNIAIRTPHLRTLYCCLEMGPEITFRRLVQIRYGLSKADVLEHYKIHDNTYSKDLDHIHIVHIPPTIRDIHRIIADLKPNVVIVDVMDAISTPGVTEDNPRMGLIINAFRTIAVQQSCAILGIHHISKTAALDLDGRPKPLSVHSGKGSSAIEQKSDTVICIEPAFLPGMGSIPEGIELKMIRTLKTRDNPPFSRLMTFDPDTFIFQTYTPERGDVSYESDR